MNILETLNDKLIPKKWDVCCPVTRQIIETVRSSKMPAPVWCTADHHLGPDQSPHATRAFLYGTETLTHHKTRVNLSNGEPIYDLVPRKPVKLYDRIRNLFPKD